MTSDPLPGELALAEGDVDSVDEEILRAIAKLYTEVDPVPEELVARVTFAMTMEALHAEVAELQRLAPELAGARSDDATAVQTVTFTSATLTTMITVTETASNRVRIDGWVAPGAGVAVELRTLAIRMTEVADEDGRFVFQDVPRGLAQFVLRAPDEAQDRPVITPSLEL